MNKKAFNPPNLIILCFCFSMLIHLVSSACKDIFPNNNQSSFNTVFPRPIDLSDGEYEVALLEINMPFNIKNVPREQAYVDIFPNAYLTATVKEFDTKEMLKFDRPRISLEYKHNRYRIKLPTEYLLTFEKAQCGLPIQIFGDNGRTFYGESLEKKTEITGKITLSKIFTAFDPVRKYFSGGIYEQFERLATDLTQIGGSHLRVTLDKNSNTFSCVLSRTPVVRFSDHLANVLGFRDTSLQLPTHTAPFKLDPFPGLNSFMIYTNIVEQSHVGDIKAPLLRFLPFQRGLMQDQVMSYQCEPVQYKPVPVRTISYINITIADDTGKEIEFSSHGRTMLTIDIRKRI